MMRLKSLIRNQKVSNKLPKTFKTLTIFSFKGTHWTYEIVNMLLRNTTKLDEATKIETMLESVMDLNAIDSLPSPRILDTHLKFKYLPKKFIEDRGKIVHMIRNPKSVCVSSYFHAIKGKFVKFEGTFEEFFEEWIDGNGELNDCLA